ncbi:Phenylalanine--tRNA ligase, mitochondrial [Fulvia fulva]|uniref:Phenylalanine--tRNA ligase, mitochondrial n=1 Tax=Passalora fulva TaxID=5499 RepID=A0A9Q8P3D2_PASFU|nr:Phenylalanine--tRNA ligase, mitochondrial [Fulvia fulva]KAK4635727.1 Phenylalanine--tRNA ligase, mitochondrial [Fulvia fulva]KAK4637271.1 Phenylalanine--tRNA ligase, mitochondrial [Fulvia fulva]UJO11582.1 Phenylalanine--tRNA ligase, mitochondrial [Fulvia fulva]WPV08241.1 Phenylalanine--tRNA ligase, mitochondrial [Fulvia fulva]WPV24951.1 Phenylalanine--tRNA ligase, mitochondrial [Fulvia fulva]
MATLSCPRFSLCSLPASVRCLVRTRIASQRCFSSTTAGDPQSQSLTVGGKQYPTDDWTNVPPSILKHYGKKLHVQPNHPLSITRTLIESAFPGFNHHNDLTPVVTVRQNFDSLGFAQDHPGRSRTDTYYVNKDTVLRTHTSAHEVDIFRSNASNGYTISADVYRRDAVDRSHYPVFHQIEGALTWDRNAFSSREAVTKQIWAGLEKLPKHDLVVDDPNPTFHPVRNPLQTDYHSAEEAEAVAAHLKRSLENMVVTIFAEADKALAAAGHGAEVEQEPLKVRWVEAFFPHTSPSWELEVWWRGDWLEVLGCGVIDQPLLNRADVSSRIGWAFGIGLERIAMLLFGIPDIRLFWSNDQRFLSQFDESKPTRRFQPFSKYPAAPRDVSFWLPKSGPVVVETPASVSSAPSPAGGQPTEPPTIAQAPAFHENDLMEVVRNTAGDSVEDVALIDDFTHPKTGRHSLAYRITYRSLEKTLTNEEANALHEQIRQELVSRFGVELR